MRFSSLYLLVVLVLFPAPVFAYDDKTTHPALTNEIVDFFNYSYPALALSSAEKALVKEGSINEDAFSRWMRHFYDPVYGRGLIFGQEWQSSKDWAEDTAAQRLLDPNYQAVIALTMPYFGGSTDYSWERAIFEYVHGDKKRGLEALGHVLHLIEDASVPDHTRNDPHPPILDFGSPYEAWTKRFNEENIGELATTMYRGGAEPVVFTDLRGYFDSLSSYSNNNFFSKDTIFDKMYTEPIPDFKISELLSDGNVYIFQYKLDKMGNYRLAASRAESRWYDEEISTPIFLDDNDNLILTDYWSHLSKQAILHGSGVVKLFFDEVEKERQSKILLAKNTSPIGDFRNLAAAFFSEISINLVNYLIGFGENTKEISQLASVLPVSLSNQEELAVKVFPVLPPAENVTTLPTEITDDSLVGEKNIPTTPPQVNPGPSPSPFLPLGFLGSAGNSSLGEEPVSPSGGASGSPEEESEPEQEEKSEESVVPDAPAITSPESFFDIFTEVDITFRGTSTPDFLIGTDFSTATTTVNKEGMWEFSLTFDEGTTTLGFFAENTVGARSATTTVTLFIDSTLPDVPLPIPTQPLSIVINEIAWRGTANGYPKDEWIELFNNLDETFSLDGLVLRSSTENGLYVTLTGSIAPFGYYLIERTDDDTISDVEANITSPFGKGLLDGNPGTLFLERVFEGATTTIDFVPPCGTGWCGGLPGSYQTMERFDPLNAGDDFLNWGTNNGLIINGFAADGVTPLLGTPKKRNSVNYQISLTFELSRDLVLARSKSPYIIPDEEFIVEEGVTLTIEPGVVIKFGSPDGSMLNIKGTILAEGSEEDPIVFTSFIDDAYGGDTNGDGMCDPTDASSAAACSFPGFWRHIRILPESEGSHFSNTIIRYGGKFFTGQSVGAKALWVEDTDIELTNSVIEYSLLFGGYIVRSNSTIENNVFRFNKIGLLVADNPDMIIKGNTFLENENGLVLSSGESPDVLDNEFIGNTVSAAEYKGFGGMWQGNTAFENALDGIVLSGNFGDGEAATTLFRNPMPYVLADEIVVPVLGALHLEAGVIVKTLFGSALLVRGALFADGTSEEKIVFEPLDPNTLPGAWKGIRIYEGARAEIRGVEVRKAGGLFANERAGIYVLGSLLLEDAFVGNNYGKGVMLVDTEDIVIRRTVFRDHTTPSSAIGLVISDSEVLLEDISFINNALGIYVSPDSSVSTSGFITFENNTASTSPDDLFD